MKAGTRGELEETEKERMRERVSEKETEWGGDKREKGKKNSIRGRGKKKTDIKNRQG